MRTIVAGAGGFIGGHLVQRLLDEGHEVHAADIKPLRDWWQVHSEATNWARHDLRRQAQCWDLVTLGWRDPGPPVDQVYNLAADMGGMGFIERHKLDCMQSVLINTHLLQAAATAGVGRYFFASSACVYRADRQDTTTAVALKESDAYPAAPEDGYGWEKLFGERMCRHFATETDLDVRVIRLHNVYGPHGTWRGGREKAPAAMCRKVAEAKFTGSQHITIWGDGTRTRSFMWIGDCIEGIRRLMECDVQEPVNLGSTEAVSINELVDHVEAIAGIQLRREYDANQPLGVHGRNSDNTLLKHYLDGWEPSTSLHEGLTQTYTWIEGQVRKR